MKLWKKALMGLFVLNTAACQKEMQQTTAMAGSANTVQTGSVKLKKITESQFKTVYDSISRANVNKLTSTDIYIDTLVKDAKTLRVREEFETYLNDTAGINNVGTARVQQTDDDQQFWQAKFLSGVKVSTPDLWLQADTGHVRARFVPNTSADAAISSGGYQDLSWLHHPSRPVKQHLYYDRYDGMDMTRTDTTIGSNTIITHVKALQFNADEMLLRVKPTVSPTQTTFEWPAKAMTNAAACSNTAQMIYWYRP